MLVLVKRLFNIIHYAEDGSHCVVLVNGGTVTRLQGDNSDIILK